MLERWLLEDGVDYLSGSSEEILDRIGYWLFSKATTKWYKPDYLPGETLKSRLLSRAIYEAGPVEDLDVPTMSMCEYVGFYCAAKVVNDCPGAHYKLGTGKRFIDYNKTLVAKPGCHLQDNWSRFVQVVVKRWLLRPVDDPYRKSLGAAYAQNLQILRDCHTDTK